MINKAIVKRLKDEGYQIITEREAFDLAALKP